MMDPPMFPPFYISITKNRTPRSLVAGVWKIKAPLTVTAFAWLVLIVGFLLWIILGVEEESFLMLAPYAWLMRKR